VICRDAVTAPLLKIVLQRDFMKMAGIDEGEL